MEKMKIKTIGACLIVSFLAVLLLSNTVSAEAVIAPPIGEQEVGVSPTDPVPNELVGVTIKWRITDGDHTDYDGLFNLHLNLKDSDGNNVPNWAIHLYNITGKEYAGGSYPYAYKIWEEAPSEIGKYSLGVQIVATDLSIRREVGNSGNLHPLLVASGGGTFTTVPEFSTIAIPVASILGLLFFFNHRKRRKNKT